MARIIGAVACSHTPTIGFAFDKNKQQDPVWAPIFEAFAPVQQWLADKKPDVLFFIYNDHVSSFFFDHYSAFSLGVGERHEVADEGGGARDLPALAGHPALARHIGRSLVADEFDMSFFQDRALDHGVFSPMSLLCPHEPAWPIPVVPLQVGVLQSPVPSARRCYKLGQALRRAIESYPDDIKVAIVATGGLSHQVHGERAGFNNTAWDAQFLDLIENDPVRLTEMTQAELATLGGMEGAEVIMWLVMRGALSSNVRKTHQSYYLPSMTGIATAIYENLASPPVAGEVERHRRHIDKELAGVEALQGTYPFTLETSVRAYRLNKFLHGMTRPAHRASFLADEEAAFDDAALTDKERDMVRGRDWRGLIQYGVIFFMLEKLGAVVGVSNLHIYAAMRGQSLEEFQQTRNAPGALYSVAGKDAAPQAWDRR
ncbi:protocatechuate 4,5-dioxygenase alpha subunit /protocatechuate 4,5-dioxygenase beta subunit [Variovorax sp. YR634]|uniref:gallate dioxygenase n=1 Tax=unclassified Variovorax TaxID=663243 RepID=UPI00089D8695|nr:MULTISPECIES: gallate dioxygenase [unclassified Variovorax]SDX10871.1 protocatechuate 4,5-dioxygenase alpha subunit /protocatechuate 4,5-dioxygenase beta subunit [Variovorax sp. YR634]SOD28942.1 protocatechuate 4,5-dioxygenase alpha subunit /protocatechuate 4,5-dioxygenase beta subunit [Variovorax sp. YR752]